ncbi:MAG: hypothetical protein E6K98_03815 [Thaumarchaeota archaeon]|nr:MAG: hypothetical protein E6K98_03815 [Nitrososphaerota archaeon]TLX94915.1 MAG: hypothetical protein E6K91_04395 [Nitrososphaerota archaeon]
MKKFSELRVGDEFLSQCKISSDDLSRYLEFSGIRNAIYENKEFSNQERKMVSGRAILSKVEGEFTKLNEMYGNLLIFYGVDGDPTWKNRQTRFLKPLYADETLKIKFRISEKRDLNDEFGLLAIDFEGSKENDELVLISKRNLYQIRKEPPAHQ